MTTSKKDVSLEKKTKRAPSFTGSTPRGIIPSSTNIWAVNVPNTSSSDPWGMRNLLTFLPRTLTSDQINNYYESVSIIRAIHDGIVRIISSLDWSITSKDPANPAPAFHIKNAQKFFENPNQNGETIQDIISQILHDLLKFDVGIAENVFNGFGEFSQVVNQYGAEFYRIYDNYGRLKGYVQHIIIPQPIDVYFEPEEILYFTMNSTKNSRDGMPIMDSIIPEINAFKLAVDYISNKMDKNQIPAGILAVKNIAGSTSPSELKRKEEKRRERGESRTMDLELDVWENVEIQWHQLAGSDKSEFMLTMINSIMNSIMKVYGISPVDLGVSDMTRATAVVQQSISQSNLIRPIKNLLMRVINKNLVWKFLYDDIVFRLGDAKELDISQKLNMASILVPLNVLDINEVRKEFGYEAYSDEKLEEIKSRNDELPSGRKKQPKEIYQTETIEEQDLSSETRNNERGTMKSLHESLQKDFLEIEKNLIQNLDRAYFGSGKTNNEIELSSHKLFGKFRNSTIGQNLRGDRSIKLFADEFEKGIRGIVKNYRDSERTKKWAVDEKDHDKFQNSIRNECRKKFFNNLMDLCNKILGESDE